MYNKIKKINGISILLDADPETKREDVVACIDDNQYIVNLALNNSVIIPYLLPFKSLKKLLKAGAEFIPTDQIINF